MSDFKRYFTLTCISFTFLVLLYSFLAHIQYFSKPTVTTNFQLFAISSSIEFLMFFTDKLNFKNRISEILVDLLDNVIVVFALGAILKMFSFSISNILVISFMQVDIDSAIAIEAEQFGECFESEDQKNAMAAFCEKRKPDPFINK